MLHIFYLIFVLILIVLISISIFMLIREIVSCISYGFFIFRSKKMDKIIEDYIYNTYKFDGVILHCTSNNDNLRYISNYSKTVLSEFNVHGIGRIINGSKYHKMVLERIKLLKHYDIPLLNDKIDNKKLLSMAIEMEDYEFANIIKLKINENN